MKNFLQNLVLVCFSFLLVATVGEMSLRFVNATPPPVWAVPDKALMYKHPPEGLIPGGNGAVFDKLGFINNNVLREYDIVTLGDSHTEAPAWPETLSALIHTPIYNMGAAGYGIPSYKYLLPQALTFHPKIVIVGLYVGNDIFDTYNMVYHLPYWASYRLRSFVDDAPSDATMNNVDMSQIRWKGLRDFMHQHSMLYGALSQATRNFREQIGFATPHYLGTTDWSTQGVDVGLRYRDMPTQETVFLPGYRLGAINLKNKNINEGMRITPLMLKEIQIEAKAASSTLVLAILPTKERVYYNQVKEKAKLNLTYVDAVVQEDALRAQIFTWCESFQIKCIDILPTMEGALQKGEVLYRHDINDHPIMRGQDFYASGIKEGLQRLHLIP